MRKPRKECCNMYEACLYDCSFIYRANSHEESYGIDKEPPER